MNQRNISIGVLNDTLDQTIKHHSKQEVKELVTPDFVEGFLKALCFVKEYIANRSEVLEEEQSIVSNN
jgi:hypothetical protein